MAGDGPPPGTSEAAIGRAVREFVAPAPAVVGLDATLAEVRRLLRPGACEALPVVDEGGRLVGVVTRAELQAVPRRAAGRVRLRDLIRLRVVYCLAETDVAEAAATLRAAGASHLAVLGEGVRLLGLLARRDLPPPPAAA